MVPICNDNFSMFRVCSGAANHLTSVPVLIISPFTQQHHLRSMKIGFKRLGFQWKPISITHIPNCSLPITDYTSVFTFGAHPYNIICLRVHKSDNRLKTRLPIRTAATIHTILRRIFRVGKRSHYNECCQIFSTVFRLSRLRDNFPFFVQEVGNICNPAVCHFHCPFQVAADIFAANFVSLLLDFLFLTATAKAFGWPMIVTSFFPMVVLIPGENWIAQAALFYR